MERELRDYIATLDNKADCAPLWPSPTRPGALTGDAITHIVRETARRASLVQEDGGNLVSPHMLRATGATLAAQHGVPIIIIARQLGHTNMATTERHYIGTTGPEALSAFAGTFD